MARQDFNLFIRIIEVPVTKCIDIYQGLKKTKTKNKGESPITSLNKTAPQINSTELKPKSPNKILCGSIISRLIKLGQVVWALLLADRRP
jgi:hypothetical protein